MERLTKTYDQNEWAIVPDAEKPFEQLQYLSGLLQQITTNRHIFIARLTRWNINDIAAALADLDKEIEILKNDRQFIAAAIMEEKNFQYKAAGELVMQSNDRLNNKRK